MREAKIVHGNVLHMICVKVNQFWQCLNRSNLGIYRAIETKKSSTIGLYTRVKQTKQAIIKKNTKFSVREYLVLTLCVHSHNEHILKPSGLIKFPKGTSQKSNGSSSLNCDCVVLPLACLLPEPRLERTPDRLAVPFLGCLFADEDNDEGGCGPPERKSI